MVLEKRSSKRARLRLSCKLDYFPTRETRVIAASIALVVRHCVAFRKLQPRRNLPALRRTRQRRNKPHVENSTFYRTRQYVLSSYDENERRTSVASCVILAVKTAELASFAVEHPLGGRSSVGKLLRAQLLHFITTRFTSTSLPCSRLYSVFVRRFHPETFERARSLTRARVEAPD